eukprot:157395_1
MSTSKEEEEKKCPFKPNEKYSTFTWNIPGASDAEKDIICAGYAKTNYNSYVGNDIIRLFVIYYIHPDDEKLLNNIKNASVKTKFRSPIFAIKSFKFYLVIYPNGWNDRTEGNVMLLVNSIGIPRQLSKIHLTYTLSLQQLDKEYYAKGSCSKYDDDDDSNCVWPSNTVKLADIQDLFKLTFATQIHIHVDKDDDIQNHIAKYSSHSKLLTLPICKYQFQITNQTTINNIKSASIGNFFVSPIYSFGPFKFFLKFYPNGYEKDNKESAILLLHVSPYGDICKQYDVRRMKVCYKLSLNETDTVFSCLKNIFGDETSYKRDWNNKYNQYCFGWDDEKLSSFKLKKLSQLTFKIEFTILEVFTNKEDIIPEFMEIFTLNKPKKLLITPSMYVWKIKDMSMINKIKAVRENYSETNSKILQFGPIKLCLQFNPITTYLHLKLLYFSPLLQFCSYTYIVKFIELDIAMSGSCHIDETSEHKDFNHSIKTGITASKLQELNELTFCLQMDVLDSFSSKNTDIVYSLIEASSLPTAEYIWKIQENDIYNQHAISPIFTAHSLEWSLEYNKKLSKIILTISSLPHPISVLKVCAECVVNVIGTNYNCRKIHNFDLEKRYIEFSVDSIQNKSVDEVKVEIKLIDIYSKKYLYTEQFVNQLFT